MADIKRTGGEGLCMQYIPYMSCLCVENDDDDNDNSKCLLKILKTNVILEYLNTQKYNRC